MNKVTDILFSWYTSFNPSDDTKKIAEARALICDECPFRVEIDNAILSSLIPKDQILNKYKCSACGCPLAKKIFSPYNSCPKKKWDK